MKDEYVIKLAKLSGVSERLIEAITAATAYSAEDLYHYYCVLGCFPTVEIMEAYNKISERLTSKPILDACCGSQMFRNEKYTLCGRHALTISPDVIANFRNMPIWEQIRKAIENALDMFHEK